MIAYPGYTVRKIEDELSPREIKELLATWGETQPVHISLGRVETMLAKVHGFKKKKKNSMGDSGLLGMLKGEGLLPFEAGL